MSASQGEASRDSDVEFCLRDREEYSVYVNGRISVGSRNLNRAIEMANASRRLSGHRARVEVLRPDGVRVFYLCSK